MPNLKIIKEDYVGHLIKRFPRFQLVETFCPLSDGKIACFLSLVWEMDSNLRLNRLPSRLQNIELSMEEGSI